MSWLPARALRAGALWDSPARGLGLDCPIGDGIADSCFVLEGFGAGAACPKGQIRLFAGGLVDQRDHQSASR